MFVGNDDLSNCESCECVRILFKGYDNLNDLKSCELKNFVVICIV